MYQAVIFVICLFTALLTTDFTLRKVLHFPASGVKAVYHIFPHDAYKGGRVYESIYRGGAQYFDTEAGYQVFARNNFGLPGLDLGAEGKENIYVVGNSFIEARVSPPRQMATSVFMDLLQSRFPDQYQVVNLGVGGQPPYFSLYKTKFWSRILPPRHVILVLEWSMLNETGKISDNLYHPDSKFGTPVTGIPKFQYDLRSLSASINAFYTAFAYTKSAKLKRHQPGKITKVAAARKGEEIIYQRLWKTIAEFQNQYGGKFMIFSLLDPQWNARLKTDCVRNGIRFSADSTIRMNENYHLAKGKLKNQMGRGHFNAAGNRELGRQLYLFFEQICSSRNL
jgi:hypothetical protein